MILKSKQFIVYLDENEIIGVIKESGELQEIGTYLVKILLRNTAPVILTFKSEELETVNTLVEFLVGSTPINHKLLNI